MPIIYNEERVEGASGNEMTKDNLPDRVNPWGTAAEKLVDTVKHVIDLAAGPDRLRAKAKAEADIEIIQAETIVKVHAIEARAEERVKKREIRRQANIESIVEKASKALPPPDQISSEPVNEDWTTRFFDECADISNEEMQSLWGSILAGEIARPGTFSPKTLTIVRDLLRDDAQLFSKLCGFIWFVQGAGYVPVIRDVEADHVKNVGLNFARLTHLTSIGLVEFSNLTGYAIKARSEMHPQYCGKIHSFYAQTGKLDFNLGKVLFTAAGEQLARIAGGEGAEEIRVHSVDAWTKDGWLTTKPPEQAAADRPENNSSET